MPNHSLNVFRFRPSNTSIAFYWRTLLFDLPALFLMHRIRFSICALALLEVAAPNFWTIMQPLSLGYIPVHESTLSDYGYPIDVDRMSVTTGILSRIDFNLYTHSAIDSHLAIQISAQINPGNSGGPV